MRIIAGSLKSRKIDQPPLHNTRPTSDRVRESVFNILSHQLLTNDQTFESLNTLDLFAGSGALGFEAVSRGCTMLTCIDNNIAAIKTLRDNTNRLCLQDKVSILHMNVLKLPSARQQYSLIFLDPPYGQDLIPKTLKVLISNNWLHDRAIIVCESGSDEVLTLGEQFSLLTERSFSHCRINFIRYNKLD